MARPVTNAGAIRTTASWAPWRHGGGLPIFPFPLPRSMDSRNSQLSLRRLAAWFYRLPVLQRWWAARFQAVRGKDIPWTPLASPLPQCRVALVTTGGVHLASDRPFDMSDPRGDPSYRVIPAASAPDVLTITHDYYDHRDADRDINVVFPIGTLQGVLAEGRIGSVAPRFYSLMGHIEGPHVRTLMRRTAPELASRLRADGADAVLLIPA